MKSGSFVMISALVLGACESAPPAKTAGDEATKPAAGASAAPVAVPVPAPVPVQTGPVAVAPAAKSFRLGAFTLISLRDATFRAANDGKLFGVGQPPTVVAEALKKASLPEDRIDLNVGGLLVKNGSQTILLDSGLGAGGKGVLVDSLKTAGVQPTDVTDIFITHGHGDHVGGLVTGEGALAFPNANIRLTSKEWTSMQGQADAAKNVKVIGPKVKTFEPGSEVLPGITPIELYGHTPGHVGYEVKSGGQRIFDLGDAAHSSVLSLGHPEWVMGFDGDAPLGEKVRRSTLARLASEHELVYAPHFPFPSVGYVSAQGPGFAWKAQVPGE